MKKIIGKSWRMLDNSLRAACILVSALAFTPAMAQTYSFSTPIQGYSEVDLSFGTGSIGGSGVTFGQLNETLYYDAAAQTLQQVGSVSLGPPDASFGISWMPGLYFGPPPAPTGMANLTIGDGTGAFTFDSGTQNGVAAADGERFYWTLDVPVSGVCTIVNDGQTNSGAVNYSVGLDLMTTIQSAGPDRLALSECNITSASPGSAVATIGGVGLMDGTDDGTYYYSWNLDSISATAVPEPGVFAIFGCGLCLLVLWCFGRLKRPVSKPAHASTCRGVGFLRDSRSVACKSTGGLAWELETHRH